MHRSKFVVRALALALSIVTVTPSAASQEMRIVLRKGLPILGAGGEVRTFLRHVVLDGGLRYSVVKTTNPDLGRDDVLLLNTFLSIPEGALVGQPAGAVIAGFIDLDVNAHGFVGWPLDLETGNDFDDSGMYWNTLLLVQEGSAPAATSFEGDPLPTGILYEKFSAARMNDSNSFLYSGRLIDSDDDKTSFLARLETDGTGNLISEEILAWQDHPLPATGENVNAVGSGTRQLALNNAGQWMGFVELNPIGSTDRESALLLDGEILYRQGQESILSGRSYVTLNGSKFDLNDFGDHITTAFVDGDPESNALLLVNGELFAQKGEIYSTTAPDRVDQWSTAPVYIANSGDVYWHALTDGDESTDQVISRNQEVVIRKGVTIVEGESITSMERSERAYHVSDSGRFLVAEVDTANNDTVVVLADFGAHYALPGCADNPGVIRKLSGDARLGKTLEIELDGAQGSGVLPLVYWSIGNAGDPIPSNALQCGIDLAVGEVMIDLRPGSILGVQRLAPYAGAPLPIQIPIPSDLALLNRRVFGQGVFWDVAQTTGGPTFQLTNGYYVEIGAP